MLSLVGRDRELAHLSGALDRASAGRGSLQLLSGEPGIGKTRLADELASIAHERGVPTFWGRCWEAQGAPAYWPWTQLFAAMARSGAIDADRIEDADLAQLVLPGRLPQAVSARAAAGTIAPEAARFHLFQQVSDLLRQATTSGPMLLIIDDLHAADHSSLALLQFVARSLRTEPIVILCTYRDAEASLVAGSREVLARVLREGEQVPLVRLNYDEVLAMLGESGVGADSGLVRRVFKHTEGNPLYVNEVAHLLVAHLASHRGGSEGDLPIPLTVQETIRERLQLIPDVDRRLLRIAAVIGKEIDGPLLAAVADLPLREVIDGLGSAVDGGLLIHRGADRYAFAHVLIREVLYADQPVDERVRRHGLVAEALADPGSMGLDVSAQQALAERARHLLLAGPDAREQAVSAAVSAALQAADLHAHDDAVALLKRARRVVAADGAHARPLVCDLLRALGTTLMRAGENEAGQQACRESIELGRRAGDMERLARGALALGSEFRPGVSDPDLISVLEEARERLDPAQVALHARLLSRLAAALQPAPDSSVPMAMAEEAIGLARRADDNAVLLEVLYSAMGAMIDYAPPDRLLPLTQELTQLCVEANDLPKLLRVHALSVFVHLEAGERTAAEARAAEYKRLLAELDLPPHLWIVPMIDAGLALLAGRFAEADRLVQEGERLAEPGMASRMRIFFFRESLLRTQEREGEYQQLLRHSAEDMFKFMYEEGTTMRWLMTAATHARAGRVEQARGALARMPWGGRVNQSEYWSMELAAECATVAGQRDWVPSVYEKLLPRADYFFTYGLFAFSIHGPVSRALGLLADVMGRWPDAQKHFEHALERCRVMGARPAAARTAFDYAAALARHGEPAKAEPLCRLACEEAESMAMPALFERAKALRHGLAGTSATPSASASPSPVAEHEGARPGLRRLGSYGLVKRLGRGGMGEVWLGEHLHLKRRSAIKLIRADQLGVEAGRQASGALRRFEREAQATAALTSPHTVRLYDFGVSEDGAFYYAMELLEGCDLHALVKRHGSISAERTVHVIRQVCDSLEEAHFRGIIHRDLKPSNVFLCRSGMRYDVAKVLDFGLARFQSGSQLEGSNLTVGDVVPGTPGFIAPESALHGTFDARSDLYAVGCVSYWLLTGALVFRGSTALEQLMGHVNDTPSPPSLLSELGVPPALDAIVLSCLEKQPEARPQTARELSDRLAACELARPWTESRARRWWQTHEPDSGLDQTG